ncbi:MAG TPA: hypothetical protein VGH61_04765, partial [Steroidobacteraceae bacterium]
FSSSTRVGAVRAGRFFYATILADYSHTLGELRAAGYASYARRQLSPYLRATVDQLLRPERSITERIIGKIRRK